MVIANLPHLDIHEWLQRLDLLDYEEHFKKYKGVEDLISFSESDIKELGVKNSSHRARMVSSLVALNGEIKLQRFRKIQTSSNPQSSVKFFHALH